MDDLIRHPLAYARMQRGWTQDDLAQGVRRAAAARGLRSGTDRQRVWQWEHKIRVPNGESQILLGDVFGVPENHREMYGWPDWLPGHDLPLPFGSEYTVQALREAHRSAMDRRTFMTISAVSLVGLASQWATIEPGHLSSALGGKSVDLELVEWLEATSAKLNGLPTEQRQHTAVLLDAHLATVTDLLEQGSYGETLGRRLHTLAASLAITCGWYRFDQGRNSAAGKLWDAALHSALAAGDRDLGAGVLSDFAYQATWLENPRTAADLLDHALTRARHPTARSLLHLRKARAHAALGERSDCFRNLADAETALDSPAAVPAPGYCVWMSPADLAVDSGRCLLDLGHTDAAHQRITEGITLLPRARDKTRAVFLTYSAESFLRRGEVEQALLVTNQSLDLANRIGADRCVKLVRGLASGFRRHRDVAGVAEFLEQLRLS